MTFLQINPERCQRDHNSVDKILEDRQQVVVLRHNDMKGYVITTATHISNKSSIKYGESQGSVLGPLLFLLYIDDINDIIEFGKLILLIYCCHQQITTANKISMGKAIGTLMSQITRWFQKIKYTLGN